MVVTIFDVLAAKFIPVQIELPDINLDFEGIARTATIFLSVAQKESETPIVALEIRESKTRGVYLKYLAEKPNKHNVRRKTFAERWEEIRNTVYEYSIRNDAVSENFFEGQLQ